MEYILSFCRNCGILLPSQDELYVADQCNNCNAPVAAKSQRIEGLFSEEDAHALQNPPYESYDA